MAGRSAHTEAKTSGSKIEITDEMIAARIEAADLISYEWGETAEGTLVSRVYRAMRACSPRHP
jgi:hypothetical protein